MAHATRRAAVETVARKYIAARTGMPQRELTPGALAALAAKPDAILFIDEIHTVVGAGATSGGSPEPPHILKPVLALGELRCIGSTTFEEYKNLLDKDRALSPRVT